MDNFHLILIFDYCVTDKSVNKYPERISLNSMYLYKRAVQIFVASFQYVGAEMSTCEHALAFISIGSQMDDDISIRCWIWNILMYGLFIYQTIVLLAMKRYLKGDMDLNCLATKHEVHNFDMFDISYVSCFFVYYLAELWQIAKFMLYLKS